MATITKDNANSRLQRAVGHLDISVTATQDATTRLKDLREAGSFRAIFPHSRHKSLTTVILNTAGGVTGGDQFTISAKAENATHLNLTTQAAERVYAARDQIMGRVRTKLHVGTKSQINWLPQETILFDQCALDRRLDVSIADDGRFLMVEPMIFGRTASNETLKNATLKDRASIKRNGKIIYADGVSMQGDIDALLSRSTVANHSRAMANIVLCAPNAEQALKPIQSLITSTAGVSLQSPDVLVVRALAEDGYALRKAILPILDHLTYSAMPKNWRL